jgi:DNA-binding FadR family transcriptional regulator
MRAPTSRLYEHVAASIAAKIAAGEYSLGKRLPSERDLAQTYDVSRPTIREAVIALELDGQVEVRMGSGVYVVSQRPRGGVAGVTDVGPFELLEARRAVESEACALAAVHIDDMQLGELEALLREINSGSSYAESEVADRKFHSKIAECTANSAMQAMVDILWEMRERSPQYKLLSQKAHEAGIGPDSDEHATILEGLRRRDPVQARNAMRTHLTRVIESLLEATEVHELEQARQRVNDQRRRYASA